jgi:amidohydrolase
MDFMSKAQALREELVARRRDLHQHPELAFQEVRTSGIVANELNALGMEVQTGVGKTGVIGILEGNEPGPTILVRADMDALPIHEENKTDYNSTVDGKMHACGHDGHTSIALGVAKLLSEQREQINGRVKFVFQPAEEIAGGAKAMIADGALEGPRPDVVLGLHLWNGLPVGQLGVADGPVMAGSNSFKIEIVGRGGHGANPHSTADPIVCGTQVVSAFQSIISRNVDPFESGVVSVTQFHAGDADNVIPQRAILRGTTRAFRPHIHQLIAERMQVILENTSRAMNCTASIEFYDGTRPVINHPDVSQQVREAVRPMVGENALQLNERTMGAEDMGYFMEDIPGMFFFVGSANSEMELDYGHHHPAF